MHCVVTRPSVSLTAYFKYIFIILSDIGLTGMEMLSLNLKIISIIIIITTINYMCFK